MLNYFNTDILIELIKYIILGKSIIQRKDSKKNVLN